MRDDANNHETLVFATMAFKVKHEGWLHEWWLFLGSLCSPPLVGDAVRLAFMVRPVSSLSTQRTDLLRSNVDCDPNPPRVARHSITIADISRASRGTHIDPDRLCTTACGARMCVCANV